LLAEKIEERVLGRMSEKQQKIEKIRKQKRKRSKRAKEKMLKEKRNVSCKKEMEIRGKNNLLMNIKSQSLICRVSIIFEKMFLTIISNKEEFFSYITINIRSPQTVACYINELVLEYIKNNPTSWKNWCCGVK
jgi:hypothetical protein